MKKQSESVGALQKTSFLDAGSSAYVEGLYEQYMEDPHSVDVVWQKYFSGLSEGITEEVAHSKIRHALCELARHEHASLQSVDASDALKYAHAQSLEDSYRHYGHYAAKLDPLGIKLPDDVPELSLAYHHLSDADLDNVFTLTNGSQKSLQELISIYKAAYCQSIGTEYAYVENQEERLWIQERLENTGGVFNFSLEERKRLLGCLTAAEGLEKYLGLKYVGQKRFSLEGGDALIPLLDLIIQRGGGAGVKEFVLGMAHRGRLNVLVNLLGKSPSELFSEFEGTSEGGGTGDVKYHKGFSSDVRTPGGDVHVAMAFNPSHLEIVGPVVAGSVRARQVRRNDAECEQVMSILVHGDAAFSGQGVVMESFAMSGTRGFNIGGTVHVVVNNQVGFTTDPEESRSGAYCTDIAKMTGTPVFHVNADDAEAVLFVAQLAVDYRLKFKKDVVIDLICYRRHGHNEADEPSATQPLMYRVIKKHPTPRKIYADWLNAQGMLSQQETDALVKEYRRCLEAGESVTPSPVKKSSVRQDWTPYIDKTWEEPYDGRLSQEKLIHLAKTLSDLPEGFKLQPQVKKTLADRQKMTTGEVPINWGYAEVLAYATLLDEGYSVRVSGQDCGRGTFSHRHSQLRDQETNEWYTPLECIAPEKAHYVVINSLLSEEAVLAFEYGYATAEPQTLVIWEAQFGDFANGAQVVFDQFISSGEQKWGRLCGLATFLPHGYEGMGPEHSSARLERYLQLSAQHNMQVCVPTTPSQIYHLIRRQMVRSLRKPLIVLTPKSLLRHHMAVSSLKELAEGMFENVIAEVDALPVKQVNRVVLCSGKVYYDLVSYRKEHALDHVAVVRIEQLYPFPRKELQSVLAPYAHVKDIVWCQEEPKNQGAWYQIQANIRSELSDGQVLRYVGRTASAAPAVGSAGLHKEEQEALVAEAIDKT